MCDGHNASCDARALHIGSYSAWLMKVKGDGARARWMSSASKRYFTIDYDSQLLYYSHSEDRKKISNPIRFKEILGAEQLPRPSQAPFKGLSSRTSSKKKDSNEFSFGFVVQTPGRNYELFTVTYLDAKHWVDGIIAGRDIANGIGELKPHAGNAVASSSKTPIQNSSREPSRSSLSTTADGGSDSGRSRSSEQDFSRSAMPPPAPPPRHNAVSSGYGTQTPPVAVTGNSGVPFSGGFAPAGGYGGVVGNAPQISHSTPPPPVARGGSSSLHFNAPPTVPARTFVASPEVSMMPPPQTCCQEVDPFAALDALEELAGPLPTQASSSADIVPRQSQNIQGALLREARNIVTNKSKPSAEASEALQRLRSNLAPSDSPYASSQQSNAHAPLPVQAFTASPQPHQHQTLQHQLQQQQQQPQHQTIQQQPLQHQQPPVQQQAYHQQKPQPVVSATTYHNPSAEAWDSDEDESQNTGLVKAAAPPPLAPAPLQKSIAQTPPVMNGWTTAASTHVSTGPPKKKKVDPEASGWDSEDDDNDVGVKLQAPSLPVHQQATQNPTAVPPPLHHQQATAAVAGLSDNDWDDDSPPVKAHVRAKASKPLVRDSCGAPIQPTEAFVTASKPSTAKTRPSKSSEFDDDLDDLVGEVLAAGSSMPTQSSASHALVPGFQCTGCDFQVLRIDNYIWGSGVEYMFFRNNYPNVQKMRPQLVPRKDCCAYCCQCSWKSAEAAAPLEDVAAGLRWRKIGF